MKNITDRKYYVPERNGERQFYLAGSTRQEAICNAVKHEGKEWDELEEEGFCITDFWRSEYE